jgi:hypothetical protein
LENPEIIRGGRGGEGREQEEEMAMV